MQEVTFTDFRNHAKRYFDSVEHGETVRIYRNGLPIGDLVPVPSRAPAWKQPPSTRINLKGLLLSEEIIADRRRVQ
jgi:prevent-host-death family protein